MSRYQTDPDYRERQKQLMRERYRNDPAYREQKKQNALARYYRNPVERIRDVRDWQGNYPDRVKEHNDKKRAMRAGAPYYPIPAGLRSSLLERPCAYCGGRAEVIDHIVPIARGGSHSPSNLAPACKRCNLSKGAKRLEEWQTITP